MNKTWMFAGALAIAGAVAGSGFWMERVQADNGAPGWPPIRVAVINVEDCLNGYVKFAGLKDQLKHDIDLKEAEITEKQKQYNGLRQSLEALKSVEDRERVAKEMNQVKFDIEANRQKFQAELYKREADMFSQCYKEITDLLTEYCNSQQIHMVVRTVGKPELDNPAMVQSYVLRQVVYNHPNLDLTKIVVDALNGRMNQQAAKPAPAAR